MNINIVQILSPIIVAFITIWIAQIRWRKDGYLKRKIEIKIELNRKLIRLYDIVEKAKSIINLQNEYNDDELPDLEKVLYNLRNALYDSRNDVFRLLNEYSLFRNDNLVEKIKEYYNDFYKLHPKGQYFFYLDNSTQTVGYLIDVEKEEIKFVLKTVMNLYNILTKLKKTICKNFKNL